MDQETYNITSPLGSSLFLSKPLSSVIKLVLRKLWLGASLESELNSAGAEPGRVLTYGPSIHNRAGSEPAGPAPILFVTYFDFRKYYG